MKLLIINGPNINMLGIRQPEIYGSGSYQDLLNTIEKYANENGIDITCFQSNHEGAIVINPAAYTHTSIAILDALKAVSLPAVEVHISDVDDRESFRQISFAGMACEITIKGMGFDGYCQAMKFLKNKYEK